jgi:hypothetical protein
MMTKYALLYQRLNVTTLEQETVVAHYTSEDRNYGPFEYIALPLLEAVAQMVSQGWQDLGTGGPQSVAMRYDR